MRAPGAGGAEISGLILTAGADGLELSARVRGGRVAYVYAEVLLKDSAVDCFYGPVAREHVRAERHREIRGVKRPDWGDPLELTVRSRPSLHLLTDGVDTAFCFSMPEGYDSSDRRLEGLYAPAGGTPSLRAVLTFDSAGELRGVLAYKGRGRLSTPRALAVKEGDGFTPLVQVLEPLVEGGGWGVSNALSTPLTFRDRPLRVITEALMPAEYLAGFVIQDLDGGLTRAYAPFTTG